MLNAQSFFSSIYLRPSQSSTDTKHWPRTCTSRTLVGCPKRTCSTRHKSVRPDCSFTHCFQLAYGKAGYDNEAFDVLQQLAEKAVLESRFLDASYYFRVMARTYLARVYAQESEKSIKKRIAEAIEKADAYYAYDSIFRYVVSSLLKTLLSTHSLDGAVHGEGGGHPLQHSPLSRIEAAY